MSAQTELEGASIQRSFFPVEEFSKIAPQVVFLLIFPIFFLYHTLAAFEIIKVPLPLGGFWTLGNGIGFAMLAPLVALRSDRRAWISHGPVIILGLWVLAYALWHYAFGEVWQSSRPVLISNLKLIAQWGGLYCLGFLFVPSKRFGHLLIAILVGLTLIIPFLMQTDPLSPIDAVRWRFENKVASYDAFANAFTVIAIAALAVAKKHLTQGIVMICALVGLLLLGARSEMIGFLVVVAVWFVRHWREFPRSLLYGLAISSIALLAAFEMFKFGSFRRHLEVFDLSHSASWQHRMRLFWLGWQDIEASPILGKYAGQMQSTREFGGYIHNAVSVWHGFGLVPFVIYIWLCVSAAARSWNATPMVLYLSSYTVFLMIFSASVYWPYPALAWGLLSAGTEARTQ